MSSCVPGLLCLWEGPLMARQFSGHLLRHARRQEHLSRERLAVDAGVSASALALYEQGRATPSVNTAAAIAAVPGISVDRLLGAEEAGAA
jgi:transcriptional regulator with XRE-family HTH domain